MDTPDRSRAVVLTLLLTVTLALAVGSSGPAAALPTADFTYAPTEPAVAEPVDFDFTGTCDVAPCRIQWRWFREGGSSLGTSMGEGQQISYSFADAGTYSVTARITNATSTHGSATATHAVTVVEAPPTSPGAPTGVAASISGRTVTVSWQPPSSVGGSPLEGYEVFSSPRADLPTTTVCATTVTSCQVAAGDGEPLRDGVTYTFTVRASNGTGSGPLSAPSNPVTPDLSGPVVTVAGSRWRTVLTGTSRITWTGRDPSEIVSYDVAQRSARPGGSLGPWTSSSQPTSSAVLELPVGSTVCVRVRGVDSGGNVGGYTRPVCRTAPVDDRSLTVRGDADRLRGPRHYRHTLTRVVGVDSRLRLGAVRASAAQLVATTCPGCGSVEVRYDGKPVATLSLRSPTVRHRQLFPLPGPATASSITVRPTSGRRVLVDGLSLRAR